MASSLIQEGASTRQFISLIKECLEFNDTEESSVYVVCRWLVLLCNLHQSIEEIFDFCSIPSRKEYTEKIILALESIVLKFKSLAEKLCSSNDSNSKVSSAPVSCFSYISSEDKNDCVLSSVAKDYFVNKIAVQGVGSVLKELNIQQNLSSSDTKTVSSQTDDESFPSSGLEQNIILDSGQLENINFLDNFYNSGKNSFDRTGSYIHQVCNGHNYAFYSQHINTGSTSLYPEINSNTKFQPISCDSLTLPGQNISAPIFIPRYYSSTNPASTSFFIPSSDNPYTYSGLFSPQYALPFPSTCDISQNCLRTNPSLKSLRHNAARKSSIKGQVKPVNLATKKEEIQILETIQEDVTKNCSTDSAKETFNYGIEKDNLFNKCSDQSDSQECIEVSDLPVKNNISCSSLSSDECIPRVENTCQNVMIDNACMQSEDKCTNSAESGDVVKQCISNSSNESNILSPQKSSIEPCVQIEQEKINDVNARKLSFVNALTCTLKVPSSGDTVKKNICSGISKVKRSSSTKPTYYSTKVPAVISSTVDIQSSSCNTNDVALPSCLPEKRENLIKNKKNVCLKKKLMTDADGWTVIPPRFRIVQGKTARDKSSVSDKTEMGHKNIRRNSSIPSDIKIQMRNSNGYTSNCGQSFDSGNVTTIPLRKRNREISSAKKFSTENLCNSVDDSCYLLCSSDADKFFPLSTESKDNYYQLQLDNSPSADESSLSEPLEENESNVQDSASSSSRDGFNIGTGVCSNSDLSNEVGLDSSLHSSLFVNLAVSSKKPRENKMSILSADAISAQDFTLPTSLINESLGPLHNSLNIHAILPDDNSASDVLDRQFLNIAERNFESEKLGEKSVEFNTLMSCKRIGEGSLSDSFDMYSNKMSAYDLSDLSICENLKTSDLSDFDTKYISHLIQHSITSWSKINSHVDSEEQQLNEEDVRKSRELEEEALMLTKQIKDLECNDNEVLIENESEHETDNPDDIDPHEIYTEYSQYISQISWGDQMDEMERFKNMLSSDPNDSIFSYQYGSIEQFEELVARFPKKALELHFKLSGRSKRTNSDELYESRLKKAEEKRQKLLTLKAAKMRDLLKKVEQVRRAQIQIIEERKSRINLKLKKAAENRNLYMNTVKRKAHNEEQKKQEIAFINKLEAQNRLFESLALRQEHQERIQTIKEERRRRVDEKAAKEAAVGERKRVIEAERQEKIELIQQKRRQKEEIIGKKQQERELERIESAREKAREREERLQAMHAAQLANAEELQKKIMIKQENSARRHEENIQHIRQKALEAGMFRSTAMEEASSDVGIKKPSSLDRKKNINPLDVKESTQTKGQKKRFKRLSARLLKNDVCPDKIKEILTPVPTDSDFFVLSKKKLARVFEMVSDENKSYFCAPKINDLEAQLNDFYDYISNKWERSDLHGIKVFEVFNNILLRLTNSDERVHFNRLAKKIATIYFTMCEASNENCCEFLLSNCFCEVLQSLNILLGDLLYSKARHAGLIIEICTQLLFLLECALHGVRNENNRQNLSSEIMNRLKDVQSYVICSGLAIKYGDVLKLSSRQMPDKSSAFEALVVPVVWFLKELAYPLICTSEFKNLLESTDLLGTVSLLYDHLQSWHHNLPPFTDAIIFFFGIVGSYHLCLFQKILGAEGISLQFRYIASHILNICSSSNIDEHKKILHSTILLIGYFSVKNLENQVIIQSGQMPTVLQQLLSLPFPYFCDPSLQEVLFPTLIAVCDDNPTNKELLENELSYKHIQHFIQKKLAQNKRYFFDEFLKEDEEF